MVILLKMSSARKLTRQQRFKIFLCKQTTFLKYFFVNCHFYPILISINPFSLSHHYFVFSFRINILILKNGDK